VAEPGWRAAAKQKPLGTEAQRLRPHTLFMRGRPQAQIPKVRKNDWALRSVLKGAGVAGPQLCSCCQRRCSQATGANPCVPPALNAMCAACAAPHHIPRQTTPRSVCHQGGPKLRPAVAKVPPAHVDRLGVCARHGPPPHHDQRTRGGLVEGLCLCTGLLEGRVS
jgi:hypothetical protein